MMGRALWNKEADLSLLGKRILLDEEVRDYLRWIALLNWTLRIFGKDPTISIS